MKALDCIMLVDDDEITNFLHESLLQDIGIADKTIVATNGRDALSRIRQKDCRAYLELILLDINMPVMNGFDFLRAFQPMNSLLLRPSVVVMISSSNNENDVLRAVSGGADEMIIKPLTKAKLKTIIDKYFRKPKPGG
ncbi:MAG: response regulator [Cyclobacteriaceae bacterium]